VEEYIQPDVKIVGNQQKKNPESLEYRRKSPETFPERREGKKAHSTGN